MNGGLYTSAIWHILFPSSSFERRWYINIYASNVMILMLRFPVDMYVSYHLAGKIYPLHISTLGRAKFSTVGEIRTISFVSVLPRVRNCISSATKYLRIR